MTRRGFSVATTVPILSLLSSPIPALADTSELVQDQEFSLKVPTSFYVLRRKDKGDLPDKNGNGRRGATVFTAGQMKKASVIAVERFPTKTLLDEASISSSGNLSTFPAISLDAAKIAELLNNRREKERGATAKARSVVVPSSPTFINDTELRFRLRADIEVQKPDLLMEQEGVSELIRYTDAKALLTKGGEMYVIYASALAQYYDN
eukprot:CAMPEP_0118641946 /NCGR_PEP_ID=MMETSP0785-20121206/5579_1 /TAXON_ID=91992 /ORGANISM="Bolidomonas pacifica, Strain CCMP 1866" /LENGTH=206 /DNA_ID=CAMNT_0006533477 /DNA_START=164 /DNA_END=781 /DNA_ORIENTATION=-